MGISLSKLRFKIMTRQIANEQNVNACCEKLLKKHGNPHGITNKLIKEELGGGSFSTINPLLHEWRNSKLAEHTIKVPLTEKANESLNDIANQVEVTVQNIWNLAVSESQSTFQAKIDNVTTLENTINEFKEENRTIEAHLDQSEEKIIINKKLFHSILSSLQTSLDVKHTEMMTKTALSAPVEQALDEFYQTQKEAIQKGFNHDELFTDCFTAVTTDTIEPTEKDTKHIASSDVIENMVSP